MTDQSRTTREQLAGRLDHVTRAPSPRTTHPVEFLAARFDAGLARVHYPDGLGGLGLPRAWQGDVDAQLAETGAPLHCTTPPATGSGSAWQRRPL
ncbi:hypothetical protein K6U06_16265 [Acidiferrimicrobium sp. IK]|uniref:hypothetical protein n=1 Tax=Acidiferrimicrobium sp. IK TaxID=2871700 RepID=UPI0021CB73F4|nr:hypothetical protein [Acidiferrimicrobium sp. IK]MCU4185926.1 hypothetical protein [Acidiferrimicrobium sp. IK]